MSELTLHDKLIDIQQRLKVPKDAYNKFAEFNYRNLEDIEEKLKPFLAEHKLSLTFEDDMIGVEGRVYVKSFAILSDGEKEIRKPGFAREAQTPKAKTDDAQLTGACTSYARKYAAGALFLIDETKDADSMDNSKKVIEDPNVDKQPVKDVQKIMIKNLLIQTKGITGEENIVAWIQDEYGADAKKLTVADAEMIINDLNTEFNKRG